jgi:hypothetical protein
LDCYVSSPTAFFALSDCGGWSLRLANPYKRNTREPEGPKNFGSKFMRLLKEVKQLQTELNGANSKDSAHSGTT